MPKDVAVESPQYLAGFVSYLPPQPFCQRIEVPSRVPCLDDAAGVEQYAVAGPERY